VAQGGAIATIDPTGSTDTEVNAINDSAVLAGTYTASGVTHGFVLSPVPTWPARVFGPSKPPPFSPEGFYIGVNPTNNYWTMEVSQPVRFPGHIYTATISANGGAGSFSNVAAIQLEPDDSFKVNGSTITFLSHDFGDIDGISFVTSAAVTSVTFTLSIDGHPATAAQIRLGAARTASATPSPLTITR
jgi:hypothetical protein